MTGEPRADNVLLRRVSRAMFWNASMLPVIIAVNLGGAILIRRGFGLESGAYDVALGILNTVLAHSALGMPFTIAQYVPKLERAGGRAQVVRFLGFVVRLRLALLVIVLLPFNLFAGSIAAELHMGADGVWLLRILSVLAVFRACSDLAIDTLQALLRHARANIVQLTQAAALLGAVAWTLSAGGSITTLFAWLSAAAFAIAIASVWLARHQIRTLKSGAAVTEGTGVPWSDFWRFALFMYVVQASDYFATPAFASPALAAVSAGRASIALFNVAYQIPFMAVVVLLTGFQGLYRPLFAGVVSEHSPERLRTTFTEVSKVQVALLFPAGVGLALLMPEYIAMLFTTQYAAAGPLARVLCVFLFVEAILNLGNIILSADHRYVLSLTAQALRIAGAPLFVWLAMHGNLLLATTAFGTSRLLAAGLGFVVARRLYGLRFPVGFSARVGLSALTMGAAVAAGKLFLPSSPPVTLGLTVVGIAVMLVAVRWFGVFSARELDVLERTGLPGKAILMWWLARRANPSDDTP